MTAHEIMESRRRILKRMRQFIARLMHQQFYGDGWGCEYCTSRCWASSHKWCYRGEFYGWRKCGITAADERAEIDRDRKEKERQSVEQYKDACDNEERNDE